MVSTFSIQKGQLVWPKETQLMRVFINVLFLERFITTLEAWICNWKQLRCGLLTFYFLNQSKQFVLPESQAFEKQFSWISVFMNISFHELRDQELSAGSSFSETFAWECIAELLDNAQKQLPPF